MRMRDSSKAITREVRRDRRDSNTPAWHIRASAWDVVEALESRLFLSATSAHARPTPHLAIPIIATNAGGAGHLTLSGSATAPSTAKTPAQVRGAYYGANPITFGSITGDGSGQTIAIIDAYDYPTA